MLSNFQFLYTGLLHLQHDGRHLKPTSLLPIVIIKLDKFL